MPAPHPRLRRAISTAAVALLLLALTVAPRIDPPYGALTSAAAKGGGGGGGGGGGAAAVAGGGGGKGGGAAGAAGGGGGAAAASAGGSAAGHGAGHGDDGGAIGAAAAGPAGAGAAGVGAGGPGPGAGAASSGAAGGASSAGAAGLGAATIVTAAGVSNMTEAQFVGRTFLASPAATRVAAGSGTKNTVLIKALYKDNAGRPCRVVEQTVLISGQTVRARGDICRMPSGQWALVPRATGGSASSVRTQR